MLIEKKSVSLLWSFLLVLFMGNAAQATVYFNYDAENGVIGEELPNNQTSGIEFCGPECGGSGARATIQTVGGAPQGNKYFVFKTVDSQHDAYTEVTNKGVFPVAAELGKKYYLAYYQNFERIGGADIWHEGRETQSADKGIELRGTGLRWVTSRGQWDSYSPNQDHRYTIWLGNPTYSLNKDLEHSDAYYQNKNGYSNTNPIQLDYEKWYSIVFGIKLACDNSGSVELWANGELILQYDNVRTTESCTPDIGMIMMGGTLSQPAYDAPAHSRKFDALLLTNNWQDIVNGGYLNNSLPSSDIPLPSSDIPFSKPDGVGAKLAWPISGQ